jgi:hypothetical protein
MNFLSHYYFYRNSHPYYNTGLVLPDLVKSFCKTHLKPLDSFTHPFLDMLNEGSKVHLKSDGIFHNSDFFKNTLKYFSEQLDTEVKWPRKWFLNHLLCEILLDRHLMDQNSELCTNFYAELETVKVEQISLYLKLSHVPNYQNFNIGYEKFVSYRFIFDYIHNEKIIMALNRVYKRVGIDYEFDEEDKMRLLEKMPTLLSYVESKLHILEAELK